MPSNNKKKIIKKHSLSWFIRRIGKKIYRKDTKDYGAQVKNITHAKALEMYQNDLNLEYSDKPLK
jgi:hypothetical protein